MRFTILLVLGALVGAYLATGDLVKEDAQLFLSPEVVAEINGVPIYANQYIGLMAALADEKKSPLSDADYEFVLNKLIDEELLVQKGEALGFTKLNSVIRNTIVRAVTESVLAEVAASEPTDEALQLFYQENIAFFTSASQLHVERLAFQEHSKTHADLSAEERANKAYQLLSEGEDPLALKQKYADKIILSIPRGLLSLSKLRDYIGPADIPLLVKMNVGEVSEPVYRQGLWSIYILKDRESEKTNTFDEHRTVVENEFKRRQGEQAFRNYIEELRAEAEVDKQKTKKLKELLSYVE